MGVEVGFQGQILQGKEKGREGVKTGPSSPAPLPSGPSCLLPRLGEEGASSFGLRLRTGERCSLRGRSERHKYLARGGACSHPSSWTSTVCMHEHTLLPAERPPLPLPPPTPRELGLVGRVRQTLAPCLLAPWLCNLISLVAPSKDQGHEGSPGVYPPPSPALKHTGRCPPSPTGAWSWSSCTDTARRPAERGLGLSWPSRGGQGIRGWSGQLSPSLASPSVRLGSPVLEWELGYLLTFIPGAQARVLWEAQAVWGGAGSSWAGAGARRGGARTILLAPTTAPELCIQLLPQCLPAGRLRPLTRWTRSARGV